MNDKYAFSDAAKDMACLLLKKHYRTRSLGKACALANAARDGRRCGPLIDEMVAEADGEVERAMLALLKAGRRPVAVEWTGR